MMEIRTVRQDAPLGLANAIGCARSETKDEPFAVILPDAMIDSATPCIAQLIECYANNPGCIVAARLVPASETDRFGILDIVSESDFPASRSTMRVASLTERPRIGGGPPRYGIFGRYVLEPEIFQSIDRTEPGFDGELQLTDSLALCAEASPVYAHLFEGIHYDAGSQLGFLQATMAVALKDPTFAMCLRRQFATPEPG
jgi:UTP--glucose-1-phosphate uridylyltransferase